MEKKRKISENFKEKKHKISQNPLKVTQEDQKRENFELKNLPEISQNTQRHEAHLSEYHVSSSGLYVPVEATEPPLHPDQLVLNSLCTFGHSRRKTLHSDALCSLQRPSGQSVFLQLLAGLTHSEELLHICKILQITP